MLPIRVEYLIYNTQNYQIKYTELYRAIILTISFYVYNECLQSYLFLTKFDGVFLTLYFHVWPR